jgi:hypothetical protein
MKQALADASLCAVFPWACAASLLHEDGGVLPARLYEDGGVLPPRGVSDRPGKSGCQLSAVSRQPERFVPVSG